MALINFDCPECGHNLEVETEGAGSIVDCPECHHPLQIPELPSARLRRRILLGLRAAALVVLGFVLGLLVSFPASRSTAATNAPEANAPDAPAPDTPAIAAAPSPELLAARDDLAAARKNLSRAREQADLFAQNGRELASLAKSLSDRLAKSDEALFSGNPSARDAFLRAKLRARLADPANALPVPPVVSDTEAGKGFRESGRSYLFPELLDRDGKVLRANATATAVDGDHLSVTFPGGAESYPFPRLHPGVIAALPDVDPLLSVPQKARAEEARKALRAETEERNAQISNCSSVFPAE